MQSGSRHPRIDTDYVPAPSGRECGDTSVEERRGRGASSARGGGRSASSFRPRGSACWPCRFRTPRMRNRPMRRPRRCATGTSAASGRQQVKTSGGPSSTRPSTSYTLPPTCRTRNVAWHVVPAAVSSRAMHESLDPVLDPVDVRTAILTRRVEGAGHRASRSRKKASTLWRTMWRTSSTRGETIRYIAPGKAVRRLVSAWSPAAQSCRGAGRSCLGTCRPRP